MEAAAASDLAIEGKTVKALTLLHLKRSRDLFAGNYAQPVPLDEDGQRLKLACKVHDEYAAAQHVSAVPVSQTQASQGAPGPGKAASGASESAQRPESRSTMAKMLDSIPAVPAVAPASTSSALVTYAGTTPQTSKQIMRVIEDKGNSSAAVSRRISSKWPKPQWHAPWRMYRVISGHLGWVRSVAVEPGNQWFATGSADRTIKIWDLASGELKLTLTGHIEQVTGIVVSDRHPYMFSCGLDKTVKCWDMEHNKVIRSYHGHLSGVYSIAMHPRIDMLMTGGRDSVCRVWDIRTKMQVHCLTGHEQTVCSILASATDPQVITGSHDSTIRLWDLRMGKTLTTLTFHKKSVRTMCVHPEQHAFASASADNIKKFALPNGDFLHNMLSKQQSIVNAMAVNSDGVTVTGGDNGSLWFWDWVSGHCFQQSETLVQPGSLEAESSILACTFDNSGSRLITCEADKTIKMWQANPDATPNSHPGLPYHPPKDIRRF
mmetsp:Transcript_21356/g.36381  ORF Transcript_21356/g.36381 Transcript_21356/m.36381 type:complete len:490 (-) Transcript_21356:608-2077(-)|eukprot:CAMPEP_0119103910 /NCGR_PEP_ID=MMETSP1180-20130426/2251_1 /TAXON_ID=3052 ORGANISM="Chlamydomonas cf sp, Strain CCMP681" /NCGR_SAMPLE_ID=MMETSP1180 /ASSEMBLY_ACC=CAM_ASM_000741 /LENGTH=489 /DNA_ID=CAMNT_0007088527 /DNA_START=136 /DNA_END=1605 /DNA_ORIENTATION=-